MIMNCGVQSNCDGPDQTCVYLKLIGFVTLKYSWDHKLFGNTLGYPALDYPAPRVSGNKFVDFSLIRIAKKSGMGIGVQIPEGPL